MLVAREALDGESRDGPPRRVANGSFDDGGCVLRAAQGLGRRPGSAGATRGENDRGGAGGDDTADRESEAHDRYDAPDMPDEEIPSGRNERASQADGAAPAPSAPPSPGGGDHVFTASAFWRGDGAGSGHVKIADGKDEVGIAGATELGGAGGAANPEELLLAAVAACFVNTWAIFLRKLQVGYAEPALRVTGTLSNDPAGGFRMSGAVIHARVPETLLARDRAKVEKTLSLAEKYCIISKVARAAMPVKVEIEAV